MKQYLRIVHDILERGKLKPNRTGIDTIALPFLHFEHYMEDGFPLLTTKKMGIKNIATELEGFLRGITSKKWYQERGCHIWDEWCNPEKLKNKQKIVSWRNNDHLKEFGGMHHGAAPIYAELTKEERLQAQKDENDLGPLGYSWQWRRFNEAYDENDSGSLVGTDQLQYIINTLKTNPLDRRMVCSGWNPNQMHMMALPPCHVLWNVVVIANEIHLGWFQRSIDTGYGLCYNIASYGLLLMLLAKHSGLKPGKLSGTLADCHIYVNQFEGLKEQLRRQPYELPQLEITVDEPFRIINNNLIINWTAQDLKLTNYTSWPKLSLGEIAV